MKQSAQNEADLIIKWDRDDPAVKEALDIIESKHLRGGGGGLKPIIGYQRKTSDPIKSMI